MKTFNHEEMVRRNKVARYFTEREILATAHHPFIVTCHGSFTDERNMYLIMDFCQGGEFFYYIHSVKPRFDEAIIKTIVCELVLAFEYLHSLGVIYRDLKPENILIHESGHIRLADFDLSKHATPDAVRTHASPATPQSPVRLSEKSRINFSWRDKSFVSKHEYDMTSSTLDMRAESFVGTEEYIAPEVILGPYTMAVDWWTLGVFIYEMFTGYTPFRGSNYDETFTNILKGELKFPAKPRTKMSGAAKSFIVLLLKTDPQERLGARFDASEIKRNRWFKGYQWSLLPTEPPIKLKLGPMRGGIPDLSYFPRPEKIDDEEEPVEQADPAIGQLNTPMATAKLQEL